MIDPVLAQRDSFVVYVALNPEQSAVTGCAKENWIRINRLNATVINCFILFSKDWIRTNTKLNYMESTCITIPKTKKKWADRKIGGKSL